jgi:hypothetical protein
MIKRLLVATAALAAAVAVLVALSLPPRSIALTAEDDGRTIAGVLHIHTNRSDGRSSPEEVAEIAARAGLKFIVFTDHGDATRTPDPPVYRAGVLCLDGVEISTSGGHYVALDTSPSPYPLGGEPRDVIEDVRRLGGFGVAAHPDSPKSELQWREWTAPFDGLEVLSLDTGWRVHLLEPGWRPRLRLIEALLGYPVRPQEAIASLLDESTVMAARWVALTERRRVVGVPAADAHAKLSLREVDPGDNRYSLEVPSYEASFRTLSAHVQLSRPLTGDAAADARLVYSAIRAGHLYAAVDGLASPPFFEFTASNRKGTAREGDELAAEGPVSLHVRSNAPASFETTVWEGSRVLTTRRGESDFTVTAPAEPAVYRAVVRAADRPHQPVWIVSNPIYVRGPKPGEVPIQRLPATISRPLFEDQITDAWRFEVDPDSVGALDVPKTLTGSELRFRFGLGNGTTGQFAAVVVDMRESLASYDRVTFTARAETPMRISVQFRVGTTPGAEERWRRSIYVDTVDREYTVYFDDLMPIGVTRTFRTPLAEVHGILFAIDNTNTKPGTSGRLWLKEVALQK